MSVVIVTAFAMVQEIDQGFEEWCDRFHRVNELSNSPKGLVEDICDLLHGDDQALLEEAARRLEKKLIDLDRVERMLERMIELKLLGDKYTTVDQFYDILTQYRSLQKALIRMGILDDIQYDLDDLGVLHASVYA